MPRTRSRSYGVGRKGSARVIGGARGRDAEPPATHTAQDGREPDLAPSPAPKESVEGSE